MAFGKGSVKSDAIPQHKKMAGAGMSGNFGVKPLPQRDAPHPDIGMKHVALDDSARGAPPPMKGHHGLMQSNADHGPQGKDHFERGGKV